MIEKQAIGFDKLDERQKRDVERIIDKYVPKIERMIKIEHRYKD